ncbi:MAG TPA: transposase, partial [Puia sp.]|nr:transposase [Puia sp.]
MMKNSFYIWRLILFKDKMVLKGYKYRIYPNEPQKELIEKTFGVCRLVYNVALQVKMEAYKINGTRLTGMDLCYQLAEAKKDFDWMCEVDSRALRASIRKLDRSFANFFSGSGFPKFKCKKNRQSFQCPGNTRRIDWGKSTLTIPKIKDIPVVLDRRFDGKIRTVTISRTPTGRYFASVLAELPITLPAKPVIRPDT